MTGPMLGSNLLGVSELPLALLQGILSKGIFVCSHPQPNLLLVEFGYRSSRSSSMAASFEGLFMCDRHLSYAIDLILTMAFTERHEQEVL